MKLLTKLLPITILCSCATCIVPNCLTSCGSVYIDLINSNYQQKITPIDSTHEPINEKEATRIYYDALSDSNIGKELIKDDIVWAAKALVNYQGEKQADVDGDIGNLTYSRYVLNVSEYNFKRDYYQDDSFILSYKLSGEFEYKIANINDSTSYKICGYQFTWNMQNIAFHVEFHKKTTDWGYNYRGWLLVPNKYDVGGDFDQGFWKELTGEEHIDFTFRGVCKGFSESGVQNYGYEENEQAIIDENHKYTPRLNEPITNLFLYESGYLDRVKNVSEA